MIGSRQAGSISMFQNPASSIASKDTIDFSVASMQLTNYTNFIELGYAPLLRKNPAATFKLTEGDYDRDLINSINLSLLSAKYKINPKTAVGFGINLRSCINLHTSHYNMTDSANDIIAFLEQNTKSLPFKGNAASSSWLEYAVNISRNIVDNRKMIFNVGANIRLNKGLLGLIGSIDSLEYRKISFFGNDVYEATNADFTYGYSTTATTWDNALKFRENYRNAMRTARLGTSIDIGAELLIKDQKEADWFYEGLDYNYKWKIGLSVLDIGYAKYEYYTESAKTSGMKQNMTPEVLFDKFVGVTANIASFNDTLATVVENFERLKGDFNIFHPTKLVLNIDRKLTDNIFINASMSLPFSTVNRYKNYALNDIAFIALTPRMERNRFGLYLPVIYNTKTKLHVGAAVRMGPVMVGLNNLNVFNNSVSLQNTSGYMSLLFAIKPRVKKPNVDFLRSPKKIL